MLKRKLHRYTKIVRTTIVIQFILKGEMCEKLNKNGTYIILFVH